ncbi:Uma2 family endonuclease [Anabaena minutissima FACHB-250]|nr:Uma2 family endonuclease [Anabaena minutissima FACHB-250]
MICFVATLSTNFPTNVSKVTPTSKAIVSTTVLTNGAKQPTISIYSLVKGEYQVKQFRNGDRIESLTFPDLALTAEQIFQSANLPT